MDVKEKRLIPGWHVDRSEGTKIKDAGGNTVLWTQHTYLRGRRTDEEVMEIAHLASAAPDLLYALKALEARGHTQAVWHIALLAIAKAEGRSKDTTSTSKDDGHVA